MYINGRQMACGLGSLCGSESASGSVRSAHLLVSLRRVSSTTLSTPDRTALLDTAQRTTVRYGFPRDDLTCHGVGRSTHPPGSQAPTTARPSTSRCNHGCFLSLFPSFILLAIAIRINVNWLSDAYDIVWVTYSLLQLLQLLPWRDAERLKKQLRNNNLPL